MEILKSLMVIWLLLNIYIWNHTKKKEAQSTLASLNASILSPKNSSCVVTLIVCVILLVFYVF